MRLNTSSRKYYLAPIISIFAFWALMQIEKGFFPDFLNLNRIDARDYAGLILAVTSSIIGIILAVVVLAFELTKKKAFRRKNQNILDQKSTFWFLFLSISLITISFLSYVFIPDFNENNGLTIAYILLFTFIVFISVIVPSIQSFLNSTNSLKSSKKIIEYISIEEINAFNLENDNKFISNEFDNSIVKIRLDIIEFITENDTDAYNILLKNLVDKSISLMGTGESRQQSDSIFRAITFIWEGCYWEAQRSNSHQVIISIWDCINSFYTHASENKIQLIHYEFLDFFVNDFTKFQMTNNMSYSLAKGIHVHISALTLNLINNSPVQEKISDLCRKYEKNNKIENDHKSLTQWDQLEGILWKIYSITSHAIDSFDKELFDLGCYQLELLIRSINNNEIISNEDYKEASLITSIYLIHRDLTLESSNAGLLPHCLWRFKFSSFRIERDILEKKIYYGDLFQIMSDFIIKSQKQKKLSPRTLNEFGAVGRMCTRYYKDNADYKKCFEYIYETLKYLKNLIENDQLPEESKVYLKLKKEIESLDEWLKKENPKSRFKIRAEINKTIRSFKDIESDPDYGIIKWNN